MIPVPEQFADTPNLWRLACALCQFKHPKNAVDKLLAVAGPVFEEEKEDTPL